jgi:alanyl aminopeptidase
MENAGLITYRETALLIDPRTASEKQKRRVATIITHEVAHHWFGDLVTMAWWDDLWLNESFASFMTSEIASAWAARDRHDLEELRDGQNKAMLVDELGAVRPIRPELREEGDIFGFDSAIAYDKGQAVIAMFADFLGRDSFRAGIRRYLEKHRDGNATRDDLVAALSTPTRDVRAAFRTFVDQPGIPLIQAELRCDGGRPRVWLRQSRNVPLGSRASREARWSVPVCVRSDGSARRDCMLLETPEAELALERKDCPAWIAPNAGARGYYRWSLPPDQLRALLDEGYRALDAAERLSLASNLAAAFRSGTIRAADVLAALEPVARDAEPVVAQEPAALLETIRDHVVDPARRAAVNAHLRALYRPALARLGWRPRRAEPERIRSHRAWLIELLALEAGDERVLARAAALGRAYLGRDRLEPRAVDHDLAAVALKAAARRGDRALFEIFLARLAAVEDGAAREKLLQAMAHFTDPALAERARELAFDGGLKVNERVEVLEEQKKVTELRPGLWAWTKQRFDELAPRLSPNAVQRLSLLQEGCSEAEARDLAAALGERAPAYIGAAYTLRKTLEATRMCAETSAAQRDSATGFFAR